MENVFIEQNILDAVKGLLTGRVNEIFSDWELLTPIIEFSKYSNAVKPVISLSSCETTEKERIIKQDAYSVSINFTVPDTPDSEIFCYGYAHAVCRAIDENPTLGGVAERVTVTGKKYVPPKVANCGMDWEVIITLRVTIEGTINAC